MISYKENPKAYQQAYHAKRRSEAIAAGRCTVCNLHPARENRRKCDRCTASEKKRLQRAGIRSFWK